jgi:hypothetical protein
VRSARARATFLPPALPLPRNPDSPGLRRSGWMTRRAYILIYSLRRLSCLACHGPCTLAGDGTDALLSMVSH